MENVIVDPKKQDFVNAFGLLETAEQDIKASKHLYKRKLYAHSIFYLQQSEEKLGKSLLLLIGECQYKDLANEVRHDVADFYLEKLINYYVDKKDSVQIKSKEDFQINKKIEEYKKKKKNLIKQGQTIFFEYADFESALKQFDRTLFHLKKRIKEWRGQYYRLTKNNIVVLTKAGDELIDEIEKSKLVEAMDNKEQLFETNIDKQIAVLNVLELFENSFYIYFLIGYVVILGMNLDFHVVSSRYRFPDYTFDTVYTEEASVVKLYSLISKTIHKIIRTYNWVLSQHMEDNAEEE